MKRSLNERFSIFLTSSEHRFGEGKGLISLEVLSILKELQLSRLELQIQDVDYDEFESFNTFVFQFVYRNEWFVMNVCDILPLKSDYGKQMKERYHHIESEDDSQVMLMQWFEDLAVFLIK